MTAQLDIHFHGIEKSDAIETKVRDKVAKLQKHFDRMSACRVVIEAPHRNSAKPKVFQVKIEISVPGQKSIIVNQDREGGDAQTDLSLAIRDAFDSAIRLVDDVSTRMADRTKSERSRRKPAPNNASDT